MTLGQLSTLLLTPRLGTGAFCTELRGGAGGGQGDVPSGGGLGFSEAAGAPGQGSDSIARWPSAGSRPAAPVEVPPVCQSRPSAPGGGLNVGDPAPVRLRASCVCADAPQNPGLPCVRPASGWPQDAQASTVDCDT